jgi:mercuric reductase
VEETIADALTDYLRAEGIEVRCGRAYEAIRRVEDGIEFSVRSPQGVTERLVAEQVLVATGRTPNTASLGLEEAGIASDPHGAIRVDERLRTSRPGVYAAGDVTGRDLHVYMAAYGAKLRMP